MTFSEAYSLYGPDVELIAAAAGIEPAEADRLINDLLDRRYRCRIANSRLLPSCARYARGGRHNA
jgi:hypothetical protein